MFRFVKCLPIGLLFFIFQPAAIAQNVDFSRGVPILQGPRAGATDEGGLNAGKAYRQVTKTRMLIETHMEEIPEEEQQRLEEFQAAVQGIRKEHESSEEKEEARTALETLVIEQMDRDLETREKQLEEIEARAKQLREQLEQRKAAKPEFVKLIMIMIENPAAGIGLPSEWMNSIGPSMQPVTNGGTYGGSAPSANPRPVPSMQPVTIGGTYGAGPVHPGQATSPVSPRILAPTQSSETRQGPSTGSAADLPLGLPWANSPSNPGGMLLKRDSATSDK